MYKYFVPIQVNNNIANAMILTMQKLSGRFCFFRQMVYSKAERRAKVSLLSYRVYDADNEVDAIIDEKYIMSPKDLCTIGFLDKIIQAGVTVLKIEGRGRSPEYVKTVARCYKEAAQAVIDGTYNRQKVEQKEDYYLEKYSKI